MHHDEYLKEVWNAIYQARIHGIPIRESLLKNLVPPANAVVPRVSGDVMDNKRIQSIQKRVGTGYYMDNVGAADTDLHYVLRLYLAEKSRADKYWEDLNAAELKLEELQNEDKGTD